MQRIPIILLFIAAGVTIGASAQTDQLYFERANTLYKSGQYQEAIEVYQEILSHGTVSGEVYFNLGNACFKAGDIGHAILYYEKAKVLLEDDEALEQNLKIARLRTVDEIEPLPRLFLMEWWNTILHLFSINTLAWITFTFFSLTLLLIMLNMLRHGRLRKILWISLSVFAAVAVIFLARVYQFETSRFGIILTSKVSVVSEPNPAAQEIFILHEGTRVRINRSLENWDEITLADGKTGWIDQQNLEEI